MRDEYRRGEFESRNRQLPADLNQTVAYNASARARSEFNVTPVGTPPSCYDVRSVYDSRPVNTYDFHITGVAEFATTDRARVVEMSVPEGYVAVLRSVEAWFQPAPLGADRSNTSMSMQLNGGDYPNNQFITIGASTDQPIPMFILADEFNRLGAKVTVSTLGYAGDVYVHFYGQFILKTERAYPFEIANPVNDPNCKPTVKSRTVPRAPAAVEVPVEPRAPVLTAPPPVPTPSRASPPGMAQPPFAINWRASGTGNHALLIPIQNDRGQRRDLSKAEIVQYFDFLNKQRMSGKEREMWLNFTRGLGI